MTGGIAPILWIGTRDGLLRWQAGALTPVVSDVAVTAIARLAGGRVAAGLAGGQLLVVDRDGHEVRRTSLGVAARATSLAVLAGQGERWLVGTDRGDLCESRDGGATFEPVWSAAAPLHVAAVPGRPRSALLLAEGTGGWLASEPDHEPQPWIDADHGAIVAALPHPLDAHVWLARSATQLLRSNDGARRFRPVAGWPETLRPRLLHFTELPRCDAYAIAHPRPQPPDPPDPSPLWRSVDGAQSFQPVATRLIDHARNPVGELTAVASWLERDQRTILLGTDRGELLTWDGEAGRTLLLADSLPPIDHLLAAGPAPILDPSSSGIFLLP